MGQLLSHGNVYFDYIIFDELWRKMAGRSSGLTLPLDVRTIFWIDAVDDFRQIPLKAHDVDHILVRRGNFILAG